MSEPGSNEWSHKRIIGCFCVFSLVFEMFLCSLKWIVPPPNAIIESVSYIAIGSLLGTVGERIITSFKKNPEQIPPSNEEA